MKYKEHKQYRLPGYNYSGEGDYFITICTNNREEYFGEIKNSEMVLSDAGEIIDETWNKIPDIFKNIRLDVYQIMPDHLHGIIIIESDNRGNLINQIPTDKNNIPNKIKFKSGIKNNPMELNTISLGRIIRWFKGRSKYEIKKITPGFKWQSRFYDRIIRDEKEYYFISEYITNNPLNWGNEILKNYFM